MLNFASTQTNGNDFVSQQILRYMTMTFSVLCEYLCSESPRIRNAGFSAIRLIIQHGLSPKFFAVESHPDKAEKAPAKAKSKRDQNILDLMKFSEMSLNEEVKNMRKGAISGSKSLSGKEKVIIHMLYLLTSRFTPVSDLILRLVQTFIEKVGASLEG